ncbi:aspartate chloroplastic [Chlorella sorokiniana]|uniref:Aspartate aminotransferase n=1 Tax=Chlorella sorokiniana TaxID=3076 RepID=A0A2P6U3C6_CHLSO|nr:aspartate chloroplastic [Chlorella sorokiniana]|eukprot:PRW60805.1 aspartate chloroplastic [Chlorella sorokiniana]
MFRDEDEQPYVLPCVVEAEKQVMAQPPNKEYSGYGGSAAFCRLAAELALGRGNVALAEGRAVSVQTLSGTGALRLGCEFLSRYYLPSQVVLLSSPTWVNHPHIIARCPGLEARPYRYYAPSTRSLDYPGMIEDLEAAPEGAVLVLHACGHNPTGVDVSRDQWAGLLAVAQRKRFLVLWDVAYQGFVRDLEADVEGLRLFASTDLEMLVAQSFSKNMGLYGERVGCLTLFTNDAAAAQGALEMLHDSARSMYISPPIHGGAIATAILGDAQLRAQWERELQAMADAMAARRHALHAALVEVAAPGCWDHIAAQRGMFSFTGLTRAQCQRLTDKWHIYLSPDGRISLGGLPVAKCQYVAEAIKDAVESCPAS